MIAAREEEEKGEVIDGRVPIWRKDVDKETNKGGETNFARERIGR